MSFFSAAKEIVRQVTMTPHFKTGGWSYDDYWLKKRGGVMGALNSYQRARVEWIAGRVQPNDSLLDLGCGDGAVLMALAQQMPIEAIGADISDYALYHLQENGIRAVRCDLSDPSALLDMPGADHILMLEVLEHLPRPEELLMQMLAKAKKSVIFSFPNTGFLSYRLRLLLGRFPVQWRVSPGEHLRFWTYRDLQWWLDELGIRGRSDIAAYEGIPVLSRIHPSLFGAALIAQVRVDSAPSSGAAR